ncbi:uncharacterized protein ATNIH1004_001986 [Aspergillus tanneri]|uniref:Uncharacterized protein n=1 Tax=Aspergillus tanneri TaxID=1220188 RepID=A0A5M9M3J8_9EURO|nr:uncharacterized protein ATNIH1004_001986 [Aspergillus tanneri]KAA8641318.1 hypothetical protein ATNIH1004_001986 [Aspergillus tanneri]
MAAKIASFLGLSSVLGDIYRDSSQGIQGKTVAVVEELTQLSGRSRRNPTLNNTPLNFGVEGFFNDRDSQLSRAASSAHMGAGLTPRARGVT